MLAKQKLRVPADTGHAKSKSGVHQPPADLEEQIKEAVRDGRREMRRSADRPRTFQCKVVSGTSEPARVTAHAGFPRQIYQINPRPSAQYLAYLS